MEPVTVGEWFWLILLFAIPLVNIIAFIVFASGAGKQSLVNLCRAYLMWFCVGLALAIILALANM